MCLEPGSITEAVHGCLGGTLGLCLTGHILIEDTWNHLNHVQTNEPMHCNMMENHGTLRVRVFHSVPIQLQSPHCRTWDVPTALVHMSSAPSRQNINDDLSNASETRANCMIQTFKRARCTNSLKTCYFHMFMAFWGILHALDETCFAYNPLAKSPIPRTTPPVALLPGTSISTLNATSSPDPKRKKMKKVRCLAG